MSDDYKWDMQVIAEEMAETLYGKDFYHLPVNLQMEIYGNATTEYFERMAGRADYLRKAERERDL